MDAAPADRPIRILLAEDSPFDAELVEEALRAGGLSIEHPIVANAADFRAALSQFAPDVILADWAMPGFSGADAVALARDWNPSVPCILVSGTLGEELVVEALRSGATDYVLKQRLEALVPAVRRALSEAGDHRERLRLEAQLAESQAAMTRSLNAMGDPFAIFDVVRDEAGAVMDFRMRFVNRAAGAFIGQPPDALVGASIADSVAHFNGMTTLDVFREVYETGSRWAQDGAEVTLSSADAAAASRVVDVEIGALGNGVFVLWRDVTERHRAELEMRRLATAIEQSAEAVVITDVTGRIEYVNPAFERVSGYTRLEAIGQNPRLLKSGVQSDAFYAAMWAALTSGSSFVGELTNRHKDGSLFREEAVISPVRDRGGEITSYVAVKRDVTRERALEASQERVDRERVLIAATLADLSARETPEATAEAICRQVAILPGVTSAFVGYFTADGPLAMLAFVRVDGEPVRLRRVPAHRSRILHERSEAGPWVESWVRRPWHPYEKVHGDLKTTALAYVPLRYRGRLVGLISVASSATDAIPRLTESLPALLEFAGFAGALIGPSISDLTELNALRAGVGEIIANRSFRPVFQPIVDLETGTYAGFEALTRFTDGRSPDIVFADARAAGLEAQLELATLAEAINAAAQLPPGAWVSLNVSANLVTRSVPFAALMGTLDRPVVLEVTEHVPIDDYPGLRAGIERLQPPVRVAVDDAGAGVANFNHIVELRPAFVKLDIGLVRGIDTDLTRQALMVGLVHFAGASASQTIAEGIETASELAMLESLGVHLGQGYLLGKPAPAADWAGSEIAQTSDR